MGPATQALALTWVSLFTLACRSDAHGLVEPGSTKQPPQVDRLDMAPAPGMEPVVRADGSTSEVPAPSAPVEHRVDAASVAPDANQTPSTPARPVLDGAVAADASAEQMAGPAPTWLGPVVRAKEIQADTVRAMLIYAKDVETEEAHVDSLTESKDDKRWEMGRAETKVAVRSLLAEVIYVEKLKCRRVEARELHAETVKIEPR